MSNIIISGLVGSIIGAFLATQFWLMCAKFAIKKGELMYFYKGKWRGGKSGG